MMDIESSQNSLCQQAPTAAQLENGHLEVDLEELATGGELGDPREPDINARFGYLGRLSSDLSQNAYFCGVYLKDRFGSPGKLHSEGRAAMTSAYGYAITGSAAFMVWLEQSPWNEKTRVQKGFETLAETGDPSAVERAIQLITLPIEIVPAIFIAAAVHSNNRIAEVAKHKMHNFQSEGENRAKYRKEASHNRRKEDLRIRNNWRVAQGKKPKLGKEEKVQQKNDIKRVRNNWWVAQGKKPKLGKEDAETGSANLENKNKALNFVKQEATDLIVALGLGAGIVLFKSALTNKDQSILKSAYIGLKASLFISLVSGKIGYFVAAGTSSAKLDIPSTNKTVHFEQQAQWLTEYGTDTKMLMAILLAAYTPSTIFKLYHRLPHKERGYQVWKRDNLGADLY